MFNVEPYKITQDDGEIRVIGYIINENMYLTTRVEHLHLFKGGRYLSVAKAKERGSACWGLDADTLQDLIYRGIQDFVVVAGNLTYKCELNEFLAHGRRAQYPPHLPQYFLNLSKFQINTLSEKDKDILNKLKGG